MFCPKCKGTTISYYETEVANAETGEEILGRIYKCYSCGCEYVIVK